MTGESESEGHAAWVRPHMDWSSIERARARLAGPAPETPASIGDVEITRLGREFYGWWLWARGPRIMPGPEDVNPRPLVELLPYIRYMSWEENDRLVFRIYGSALAAATGIDLTGTDTFGDDLVYPGKKEDKARLRLLHSHPCGLLMLRELTPPSGKPVLCEFMTLPIAPGKDGKDRIIGTITARGPIAETEADFKLSAPLTLRRATFFDTGHGVPDAPHLTV